MVEGDGLAVLADPVAQQLLAAAIPARLAYNWHDGTPRVVPIWFHWDGREVVLASPPRAPKLKALARNPNVSLTIDGNDWPYKVLLIRGTATVELVDGVPSEYAAAAERYLGEEQGRATAQQMSGMVPQWGRIAIRPQWVGILDFETRFPSALSG